MKLHERIVMGAVVLGILTPVVSMAASLEAGFGAASALTEGRRERNRSLKTPAELLREADDKDAIASLPPPTEKEWCEAGGHHVFLVSAKTGRKYCLPAFTDRGGGERGGGERLKTNDELEQEVAANDSFPDSPPQTEKQACESDGEHVFIVSAKTGNKYCINLRQQGPREGDSRKTQWEIDREVEANDYFAQNPPPDPGPQKSCEAFGDKVYVKSSKGVFHCLEKYTDN